MTTFRLTYNNTNVDIKVRRDGLGFQLVQKKSLLRSSSGKIQTINQHGIQEIDVKAIFATAVYKQLFGWWAWARQGKVFAFTMDSTKTGNTTLDDAAAAAQKVIPLTGTGDFTVGDVCLIRAADNDDEFELVEIASISAGVSVTAVDNLVYSYTSGDVFRHWHYWPDVISLDDEFNPKLLSGSGFYEHTFKFAEKL
uniref:Uncharacterized protein n=1 Tax=viral metagenome TaxID=1070528 RepID=A0A6H1ZBT4_9ZZZZ